MAFPASVDTVTLTVGPLYDAGGLPRRGVPLTVTLGRLVLIDEGGAALPSVTTARTDETGEASVVVVATDSTGIDTTGWTYTVRCPGVLAAAGVNVALPAAAPTVAVETLASQTAADGSTVWTPGAVYSVNGDTGAIVLTAADVGAATTAQGALADTSIQPGGLDAAVTALAEDPASAFAVSESSTFVAHFVVDDAPAAPAEGCSQTYFVTSAVSWPAGLEWSTDPDGGVEPTITGTALVSLFTYGGTTRAILGSTFPALPDVTAPSTPADLTATATSSSTVDLAWSASTDDVGVTGYEYRIDGGAAVDAGAGTTETVTGLTAETLHSFEVRAYDAAANVSAWSTADTATTPAAGANPSPADLTDQIAWFSGDTLGAEGSSIASWTDSYGVAGDMTASSQPVVAVVNGVKVARFTSDLLSTAAFAAISQPITIALLASHSNVSSYHIAVGGDYATSEARVYTNAGRWIGTAGSYCSSTVLGAAIGTFETVVMIFDGTSSKIRVNGVETAAAAGANGLTRLHVGAGSTGVFPWAGDIAEVVVVGHALNGTEITDLESYLDAKRAELAS